MVSLMSLWLPILLSAVAVFIVSSVIHMVFRYHNSDFQSLPDEAAGRAAINGLNLPPDDYAVPWCGSMKEFGSEEFVAKRREGPVGFFTLLPPGQMSMTSGLVQWFVYSLVVGVLAAYVARLTLPAGAGYLLVHRVTATAAFMGYGVAHAQASIWYKRRWGVTFKYLFDALIYGLFTGGIFGWLWPAV